jgi:methionine synthase II (cobalamin-independent)
VLKDAWAAYHDGRITRDDMMAVQRAQIAEVVAKQAGVGLPALTDGEFNRSWWHLDWLQGLTGVGTYQQEGSYKFVGQKTRSTNIELIGKVAYNPEHQFFDDFTYLLSILPAGKQAKVTIPAPTLLFRDNRSDRWHEHYATWSDYLDDLAKAYHESILHFYELGARYVQLDDTTWGYLIAKLLAGEDAATYEKLAEDSVTVINAALAGLPADLRMATHICRGNFKSTYLFEGSYAPVADYLGRLDYDTYFLEYDDARSGDFAPLPTIWNGRENVFIVLGLVTSKRPQLEDASVVEARIADAAKLVPLGNLGLSTQCGFSSTEEGNLLTDEQQWDKQRFVGSIAEEVWG